MRMKKMGAWMLLALLTLVGKWCGCCYGCSEEERIGLLDIKPLIDPNHLTLRDWVDSSNCCEWYGIECDNTTRRVIQLSLRAARDQISVGDWVLNASLFLPFKELQSLDLSSNGLVGCFENQGFEVLSSKLRKLEALHLSANRFNDEGILSCFNGLSTLKSLGLSNNGLTGSGSLGALTSLKILSLKETNLSGTSISQGTFFNSSTLEELYLDRTSLPLNFLRNIGALPALKVLSVGECDLHGTLPAQGWCELKNLEQLDLFGNNLKGSLPRCLGNLSSLQVLDVSSNQFDGNINSSPLTNLISLEFLLLSNNHFEIPVSMKPFMNHSSLKFFSSKNNSLVTEPTAFYDLIPKFQLVFFHLSNSLTSKIPNFLYHQYDLRVLDLSYNKITGMFPSWLLKNNTRLEQLFLNNNSFVGNLQLQDHPNLNMSQLDISNNKMHGQISKNICLIFPNLWSLAMANNGFTSCIPSCLGNISSLAVLDLSNNQLSTVKLEWLTTLKFLKLSNNKLGGQLPVSVFNSSHMHFLYLNGNNFWGQISNFPSPSWNSWSALDLSDNQFSGMLPRWLVNLTFVSIELSKNHFKGLIPRDFCKLDQLVYLDLSKNKLFGSIPSCFSPVQITHLHLSKNRLSGPLTYGFYNSSSLVTLDLRENNFTGSIPNWIGNLSSLSALLLRANHFDGEFPTQLCLLEQLSILDVSQNQLSGPLPSCLGNLTNFKASSKKELVDPSIYFRSSSIEKAYYKAVGQPPLDIIQNLGYPFWTNFTEEVIEFTEEVIEFMTKNMYYGYKGKILSLMSGIDLSSNNFLGAIPPELGNLSEIRTLNLSHNNLTGSIPETFSNLKQIESLDLSHNNLNGAIPQQLTKVTTLAVFSVAHNNLSGKTPERKYQFGTFEENSYEGNPFLCGPPLQNNCIEEESPSQPMPNDDEEDDGFIDMEFFYISFGVCYTIVVMTIAAILYINPYWRCRWFKFIEDCIDTCNYFLVAIFRKFSNFRR